MAKAGVANFLTMRVFFLFLAMLENSVLPMGWDCSHATLKVTSNLKFSEVTSLLHTHENTELRSDKIV